MVRRNERRRRLTGPEAKKVKIAHSCTIVASDSGEPDPNALWEKFKTGLDQIFAPKRIRQRLTQEEFMKMLCEVQHICVKADVGPCTGLSIQVDYSHKRGEFLYDRILTYLKEHLKRIAEEGKNVVEEQIPHFYMEKYSEFHESAQVLDAICKYLNKRLVRPERPNAIKLLTVYEMSLICWKNTLFKAMHQAAIASVRKSIEKSRNNEMAEIPGRGIRDIVHSFIAMGALEGKLPLTRETPMDMDAAEPEPEMEQPTPDGLDTYRTYFETPFLEDTKRFYEGKVGNLLVEFENNFTNYETKVEQWFTKETDRITQYFHPSTLPKLNAICGEILLERQFERIRNNFKSSLEKTEEEENRAKVIPDLTRTFRLVSSRLDETFLLTLCAEFQQFMTDFGFRQLSSVPPNDFTLYIERAIGLYQKYRKTIRDAFGSNQHFNQAFDTACGAFLNNQSPTSQAESKCAEYAARYLGSILKKSSKNKLTTEEINAKVEDLMCVFRYLKDKDIFQTYYGRQLTQRLLGQTTISEDSEKFVINQLIAICGQDFTVKFTRMFKDVNVSKDLQPKFKDYLDLKQTKLDHDFLVTVLTNGSWPTFKQQELTLPETFERCRTAFTNFYTEQHNGRKLTWIVGNSSGELNYRPPENTQKQYTFSVSTYQMAILLLYNTKEVYTVAELQEATKLELEVLTQILTIFKNCKLLCQEPADDPIIGPESKFRLFRGYKNKKMRININQPLKSEAKVEEDKTRTDIARTRELLIQAAIVRIMKTRQTLQHQALVIEVISAMNQRFHPEIRMIRTAIETLIQKEYMERSANDKDQYTYIA